MSVNEERPKFRRDAGAETRVMNPELIAILAVGVSLAAIILTGQRSLRAELAALRADLAALRADLHSLAERVARIEGQLAGPPRFSAPAPPADETDRAA